MTTGLNNETMAVRSVRWNGGGVFEISLDRDGLVFMPGDCLALFAADGRVSRPYSIASGIHDETVQFLIRHMPGGVVSSYLSERIAGDIVRVSPPFGWFRPGEHFEKRPFCFIATGTGVAPFRAFLRSYPDLTPHTFLYGVRKAEDIVDRAWMESRGGALIAVSREATEGCHHGRVTDMVAQMELPPDADYYLCGLDTMIDDVTNLLEARGVDITRIHRECFFNASYA